MGQVTFEMAMFGSAIVVVLGSLGGSLFVALRVISERQERVHVKRLMSYLEDENLELRKEIHRRRAVAQLPKDSE